ncbi:hypothetical protein PAECIP111893_03891 [Paenibacillus plantiphilus]|uniref:Lysine transporter LysE n=1 Tax=Paenibacillus plantiphilus TaxID=2905650 RepID=A0ABM9CL70_9BACL|nr:LysE family transporter [Paenibacillus plantiphilus]CAH1215194.1 hypothetical protein PAECIP111893_03891 [Paenibacillus plantiphilus]
MLIKGIMIGVAIAAPVGPIGLLCMKRTINQGKLFGIVSGLGAATADALYGILAAVGFGVLMQLLLEQRVWISLIGGLFLCYLGYQALKSKPNQNGEAEAGLSGRLSGAYFTTFVLTIINPVTIVSFLGIFAGISAADTRIWEGMTLVLGIFLGSLLWWLLLCTIVGFIRQMISANVMLWINRGSGIVLLLFGAVSIVGIFRM